MGRTLPLIFFLVDIFQVYASVTVLKCHDYFPNILQMRFLKYRIVFTVGEPLLLLKEPRPRPLPPPPLLFLPLYTPLPKKCCSKAMAVRANQGKGQRSSSANAPACQRSPKYVEQLQPCLCIFTFSFRERGLDSCVSLALTEHDLLLCLHMCCSREPK